MADEAASPKTAEAKEQARNSNEVALEMMKFIAVTTGYGKGATSAAGFSGKPNRTSEEYAESLIQLFERCRTVVDAKPDSK
jgi:ATP:corrinoid adenosyltransferase